MTPSILYIACVIGAIGLHLIMRPHRQTTRIVGAIAGAGAVAFIMVEVLKGLAADAPTPILEVIFGLAAITGAVRMVTHPRPVFAAIYFVLVVVSSAGMFLLLDAEFMAFSLIIVYAGAILITYLFVLMLAQDATSTAGEALYDRLPREPIAALVVGFVLLASLSDAVLLVDGGVRPDAPGMTPPLAEVESERWKVLDGLPRQLDETVASILASEDGQTAEFTVERDDDGRAIRMADGIAKVDVVVDGAPRTVELPIAALPTNTQLVGWALVAVFPVSLEIAGVILLMAMFGAVVLARRQIDLSEDEVRVAAGLQPLLEDEDSEFAGGGS
jgi:NADH-quinone oxidoreductase subunit J